MKKIAIAVPGQRDGAWRLAGPRETATLRLRRSTPTKMAQLISLRPMGAEKIFTKINPDNDGTVDEKELRPSRCSRP